MWNTSSAATIGGTTTMLNLILLVFAFVLAVLASVTPWSRPWWPPHLGWLAVAIYFLSIILGRY